MKATYHEKLVEEIQNTYKPIPPFDLVISLIRTASSELARDGIICPFDPDSKILIKNYKKEYDTLELTSSFNKSDGTPKVAKDYKYTITKSKSHMEKALVWSSFLIKKEIATEE